MIVGQLRKEGGIKLQWKNNTSNVSASKCDCMCWMIIVRHDQSSRSRDQRLPANEEVNCSIDSSSNDANESVDV